MTEEEKECSIRGCKKPMVEIVEVRGEERGVCADHYLQYTGTAFEAQPKPEEPPAEEDKTGFSEDLKAHDTPGQVLELAMKIREAEEQINGWKGKKKKLQEKLWDLVDHEREEEDEDQTKIPDFAEGAEEAQEEPDEEEPEE